LFLFFLAAFFTVSVGFAETCEEYCHNRGGLGKCAGLFSGCPVGYKDLGGSYGCSWWISPENVVVILCPPPQQPNPQPQPLNPQPLQFATTQISQPQQQPNLPVLTHV
jgi:hypothetical protein